MSLIIRKAQIQDLDRILELGTELMISDGRFDPLFKEDWYLSDDGKKFITQAIKGRNQVCFLAELEDKIVGYASCKILPIDSWRPVKRAQLVNLIVKQNYRNLGIGHQLMAAFKEWAKNRGAKKAKVETMAMNTEAKRFYEDNKFTSYLTILESDI